MELLKECKALPLLQLWVKHIVSYDNFIIVMLSSIEYWTKRNLTLAFMLSYLLRNKCVDSSVIEP